MHIVCGIIGLIFLALVFSICSSISSCWRFCSDSINDLRSDHLGKTVGDTRTSPLAAEFGITAVSVRALQEKEEALKDAIDSLHEKCRRQYADDANARFEREMVRRKAAKEDREVLERTLKKIEKETDELKETRFKLRDFALRESPMLWETRQNIRAEIEVKDAKIEKLTGMAKARNEDIEQDGDFLKIIALRNRLVRNLRNLEDRMVEAYLMKCKYDATPTDAELGTTLKRVIEDGVREADQAGKRYEELKRLRGME